MPAAEVSTARKAPPEAVSRPNSLAEWAIIIIILLFGTTLLVQPFVIPSVSMEDTLLRGDHVLVDKLTYAPEGALSQYILPYRRLHRGDIVVFRWPMDIRQNYVKRLIGMPGDRIRIANKQLFLNGRPLREPYTVHRTSYFDSYRDNFPSDPNVRLPDHALQMLERNVKNGELVVPAGMYFVMGDNRDNSSDSRYWGLVPRENIIGKPLVIWWSYDAPTAHLTEGSLNFDHLADVAMHFFTKTRWNRTFRLIRGYPLQ
jgi:signal peptidase I